jgi:predicted chitinase
MNKTVFYTYVRNAPFGGRLSQSQIDGMTAMLAAWEKYGDGDNRKLAYGLATAFHETGGRMTPIREAFATSTANAIRALDKAWAAGRMPQVRTPYWREGWFGRGRIQTTHLPNYQFVQTKTGLQCVTNPDILLTEQGDAKVFWPSLFEGWWTRGRERFSKYFDDDTTDPVGARAMVNGKDKARLIASHYASFLAAIEHAQKPELLSSNEEVPERAAQADDVPAQQSTGVLSALTALGGSGLLGIVQGIDNPYALAAAALAGVAVGIGVWMYFTGRLTVNRNPS